MRRHKIGNVIIVTLLLLLEVSTQLTSLQKVARCDQPKLINARVSCTSGQYAGKYLDGTSCTIYCYDNHISVNGPKRIDCYRGRWLHGGEGNTPYSSPARCQKMAVSDAVGRSSNNDFDTSLISHDGRCSNTLCNRWYRGIPKKICEDRGCCWNDKKKQCHKFLDLKCQIALSERSKCPETWRGIPKHMCESKGCCYNAEYKTCYSATKTGSITDTTKATPPSSVNVSFCATFAKSLLNGRLECEESNQVLNCRATCNDLYMLQGTDVRSCHLLTGQISPGFWECRREYCTRIVTSPKTFIDCTDRWRVGSVCTASCARGYRLFDEERNKATCLPRGKWSESTFWRCREILCGKPDIHDKVAEGVESFDGTRATFDCTDGRKYESVCTVSCPLGYHLHGTSSTRCGNDGEWTRGIFKCIALSCSTPSLARNVVSKCSNDFKVGSVCRYRCPQGFRLSGSVSSSCRANQRWSSDPGQTECIAVKECSVPYLPKGAQVQQCTDGYNVGSLCSIKCSGGKLLTGSNTNTIACMGNLEWHKSLEGETCEGCRDLKSQFPDADWDKLSVICTGGSKIGSVCEISCGLHGDGLSVLVCTNDGKGEPAWDGSPPVKCFNLATKTCDVDVDLSTGEVKATAASEKFITLDVSPTLPIWMRWVRGGTSNGKCQYQSLIKINYEKLMAVALRMSYEIPSSVHFQISSTKSWSKNAKSLIGRNFQLQSTIGKTLRGFFQSGTEVSLYLKKKSSDITFKKGSSAIAAISMDFETDDSLFVGLNRAVKLISKYDISRMGKGMCKFCVVYSEQ